ncbi:MAG: hypothetical protein WBO24_15085 [Nitrospirales bacterium]
MAEHVINKPYRFPPFKHAPKLTTPSSIYPGKPSGQTLQQQVEDPYGPFTTAKCLIISVIRHPDASRSGGFGIFRVKKPAE